MDNKPKGKGGLIIEPVVREDWMFGSSGMDQKIRIYSGDWTPHLPNNEKQTIGYRTMACTNFSSTTAIEIQFMYRIHKGIISDTNLVWLFDNGYFDKDGNINFSDRFDALISNTSLMGGNSLKRVAEAKRIYGLIPEKMLPWAEDQKEYFDKTKITDEMYSMGQEFLKRFPINYEIVYSKDFVTALKISPLAGALYAWNGKKDGVYYKVDNKLNHAIAIIKPHPANWNIFDSFYPFIKELAPNYTFLHYALRYIIGNNELPNTSSKQNMYKILRNPSDPEEIFAFTEDMKAKRHIVNKTTLREGARSIDKYWLWEGEKFRIEWATPTEFKDAIEVAEIILLPKDANSDSSQGGSFSLWKWIKGIFGIK